MTKTKLLIASTIHLSWCALGFMRGLNSYNYKKYKETYLYTDKFFYGLAGICIYGNPFFLIITLPKELYRLEVNIRNLEQEKDSDYYNTLT
jgi:hypothetical protein